MSIVIRPAGERGHFDHGWLKTWHTFSFGDYQDPEHERFRSLRVINEDIVEPGKGFPAHSHRDMEIVTFILEGELQHKDSMGNGSVIRSGDVQKMSAGKGVQHSEFNASASKPVHLLQLWIFPDEKGIEPNYEQKNFSEAIKQEGLTLLATDDETKIEAVNLRQKAEIYHGRVTYPNEFIYAISSKHGVWLQMIEGSVEIAGEIVRKGDGVAIENEEVLNILAIADNNRFLMFVLE